ncbi:CRISPR-associated helicase/endonuclease Cas3 [Methanolobus tindarius]|uniref:CRISPR-associated helicase/endonuclease Cas3 n=1 Tax=Methanolobus tindarius TaxID=2221 RepID=UPI00064ED68B|nr:CRISPR-associated helicase/endonuclease Cas3 [Methanolobus tindarius]
MSSYELLSHPEKTLYIHLKNVADISRITINSKNLNFENLDVNILADISYIIGACHDFGKATHYFQDYIRERDEQRKLTLKNNPLTQHGLISAVFAYYVLKQYLKEKNEELFFIPLFGYLAVKRHHGNLDNPIFELVALDDDKIEYLKKQAEAIDPKQITEIYQSLLTDIDTNDFLKQIESLSLEIKKSKRQLIRHLKNESSTYSYILFQLLYSILLNSDKTDAASLNMPTRPNLSPLLVDEYRKFKKWDKTEEGINNIRNLIYSDVTDEIKNINLDHRIYSLNVPTGTGKTLTSFSLSLKLREKIESELNYSPKIIYSLPFLSIIDQNYSVFEDVFKTIYEDEPDTSTLLKHHHLSDIQYTFQDDEFKEDKALLLIEGWNSEIVVTTFIQFFHSLISNRNRSLRKFHNIANSIVILDEVQSIPHKYWLLFKELIITLSKHLNTYFIFVTATQPLIYNENEREIVELAKNKNDYFSKFDRISLQYLPEPMSLDDFKEKVRLDIETMENNDFLIVLNTINASKKVYEHLTFSKKESVDYFYLSTHITPKERLERIKQIKNTEKRRVIVSTQLIEAGVDIDVDVVYRDMSTLDSINQVAGRCNRNFDIKKKGEVKVFILKDERKEYYKYIYSTFLIDKTKETLDGTGIIKEKEFLELNNEYFKKIKETQSEDEAKKILDALHNMRFDYIKENFHLIENDYEKADVFIEIDDNAHDIWQQFKALREIKNSLERKNKFLNFKKQFYEYVISVPKAKVPSLVDSNTEISYVSLEILSEWYNKETGFIAKEEGALIF